MSTDEPVAPGAGADRRVSWGARAWLAVLAITGVVQLLRDQWVDAALFGGAFVLVLASALWPRVRARETTPVRAIWVAAGALPLVVALSALPRHSGSMSVVFVAAGAAAAVVGWRRGESISASARRFSPALRALAWSWSSIAIVACLWELLQVTLGGLATDGRTTHPALSDLLDPLIVPPVGQTLFAVAWVALGLFLATRGRPR